MPIAKPLTDGMRELLTNMVEQGGWLIGAGHYAAQSRAKALRMRGYAMPPAFVGGKWHATDAGRAALVERGDR